MAGQPTLSDRVTRSQLLRWLCTIAAVLIALLPIISITKFLATTGANNMGNDYMVFITPLDQMLSGGYDWTDFPRDSFLVGSHSMAIPVFIFYLAARFAAMNEYTLIYLGIAFNGLRLLLLYDIFTYHIKHWAKVILLPLLAFILFSNAQLSVFGFSLAGLQIFISLFGFTIGIWGLVRFAGQWRGCWLVIAGGLTAAWSGGYGVMALPVLLLGMFLFNFRNPKQYALFMVTICIAALPYIFYRVLAESANTHGIPPSFQRFPFMLELIGYPFGSNLYLPAMHEIGQKALIFLIPALGFIWLRRPTQNLRPVFAALLVLLFSLGAIYQITVFRLPPPAPWYTTIGLSFWTAVVGLVFAICFAGLQKLRWQVIGLQWVWGMTFALFLGWLFLYAKPDTLDKAFYLWMRRPVSASCMLHYRIAPTYCEEYVFQWMIGNPQTVAFLAEPLERHQISTFAPHQTWTLQGDFGLNNVQLEEIPEISNIMWSGGEGTSLKPINWHDFHHLNLFLHSPSAITWTVVIPSNVEKADFHSAVAISESVAENPNADGVRFLVSVKVGQGDYQTVYELAIPRNQYEWQPFIIPLAQYAGQQVTLRLSSDIIANIESDWAMYRYPYIEVVKDTNQENTAPDLQLDHFPPTLSDRDHIFDLSAWTATNMTAGAEPHTWALGQPHAFLFQPTQLCLTDYNYFYLRMNVPPSAPQPRYLEIGYILDNFWGVDSVNYFLENVSAWNTYSLFRIPLHAEGVQEYYYPIRLLELPDPIALRGIRLEPVGGGNAQITIEDFRLIRNDQPSKCI